MRRYFSFCIVSPVSLSTSFMSLSFAYKLRSRYPLLNSKLTQTLPFSVKLSTAFLFLHHTTPDLRSISSSIPPFPFLSPNCILLKFHCQISSERIFLQKLSFTFTWQILNPKYSTMAMTMLIHKHAFALFFSFLLVQAVLTSDPPQSSSSPSPGQSTSPLSPPLPEAGAPLSPSPSPQLDSPPAPPPSNPDSSPTPAPARSSSNSSSPAPSPALVPAPDEESDVNNETADSVSKDKKDSSGGMSGGQKAGVAFGVVAGACIVILGGVLYKKRQDNIRRSQYGYGARIELL